MSNTFNIQQLKVRHRDNFECRKCGQHETEEIEERGRKLSVHHIKPRKEFSEDEYEHDMDNLITLCNMCHMVVESNDYNISEWVSS
jgi:5-methylcytosine-specific restriction endonuclease McrA